MRRVARVTKQRRVQGEVRRRGVVVDFHVVRARAPRVAPRQRGRPRGPANLKRVISVQCNAVAVLGRDCAALGVGGLGLCAGWLLAGVARQNYPMSPSNVGVIVRGPSACALRTPRSFLPRSSATITTMCGFKAAAAAARPARMRKVRPIPYSFLGHWHGEPHGYVLFPQGPPLALAPPAAPPAPPAAHCRLPKLQNAAHWFALFQHAPPRSDGGIRTCWCV